MRITDYLDRQERMLDKSSVQIKDFHVFDFNWIPDEPLMREEAKPIIDACLRYVKTGIANHLFVFGSRGCGKTLTVRYLQGQLDGRDNTEMLYVNCRQHNTSFKILADILGIRPRGISLSELWHRFCDAYPGKVILVLDEVDLLSDKDRHKDILYLLARSDHNHMALLLSNHPKFLNRLDESIRSSLQPEMVFFRNYDALELQQILIDRAHLGLHTYDEILLKQIAAMAASTTNSDVRVAIKTLYYAALESSSDVRLLFNRARRDLVTDVLADLNERGLLILKAAVDSPDPFVKSVYDDYRRLSLDQHEEPFSYVHFYTNLSYLQSIGLILLISAKVGRTYTNRIQTLFDQELFEGVWHVRFG